jgi:hypothetical protein
MLVEVAGIENFVGNIKQRYRLAPMTDDADAHHDDFAEQLDGWLEVERGTTHDQADVVARLEADDRRLVADFLRTRSGLISYRVWALAGREPDRAVPVLGLDAGSAAIKEIRMSDVPNRQPPLTAAEVIELLKPLLEQLTPEQRVDLVNRIDDDWCLLCGYAQPKSGSCQCNNDE